MRDEICAMAIWTNIKNAVRKVMVVESPSKSLNNWLDFGMISLLLSRPRGQKNCKKKKNLMKFKVFCEISSPNNIGEAIP